MIKHRLAAVCIGVAALAAGPAVNASEDSLPPPIRAQVEGGKEVFASTCANGMCHGAAGIGGKAPSLQRPLQPEHIVQMLQNGKPGTPMPAFKDVFDAETQAKLVAYVTWLSSNGREPTTVVTIQAAVGAAGSKAPPATRQDSATPWLASKASTDPVPVGSGKGVPAKGVTVFFDATKSYSCRGCHTFSGAGGPVGPDLVKLDKTPSEIYASLTKAKTPSAAYPVVALTLRDGTQRTGVKRDETEDAVRYYDVSSVPPISRRVAKADIANATAETNSGVFDHGSLPYTKQDLMDVSAFIGKPTSP